MSRAKAIFLSAAWNHAGKILEYVLLYATSVLIARSLGVSGNGVFAGLISVSQLLLVLCSFGLEVSLNRHLPQLTGAGQFEKTRFILRRALGVRLMAFGGVASLCLACFTYFPAFVPPGVREYVWLLLAYAGVNAVVPLLAMVLTAQLRTPLNAAINTGVKAIELAGVVVLGTFGTSVQSLLVLFICTGVLEVLAYVIFSKGNVLGGEHRTEINPIITFGSIYWVNIIVDYFLGRHGDILFLMNLLPSSSQASLYDVAYSVTRMASLAMTVGLGGVTLATFASLAISPGESMDRFYTLIIKMNSLLTIPLFAFLLFNARGLVEALYSPEYAGAIYLVQGMAAFRIVSRIFAGSENAEYLLALGRVPTVVVIGIVAASLNIALNIILIPTMGATGAVVASGSANLAVNMLGAVMVYRISSARPQILFWMKVAGICCPVAWVGSMAMPDGTLPTLAGGMAYLVIVLALLSIAKPLSAIDSLWLSRIDRRLVSTLRWFTRNEPGMETT